MDFAWITNIGLIHYLVLALVLFCIGLFGIIISKNIIKILICIELMLNAVCINFVAFANYLDGSSVNGMIFALFIIAICATQVAIGLALVLSVFNYKHTVNSEKIGELKG
ncbi:MAG: NADH-quinone oxidoreductase subunit NuoK [Candidatus Gastranaerophilales bacterium]|nr:NADH-quinone oxidoreductase subunit NuoK [Candidatus Gastranaerophilales bacterium]